MAADFVDSIDVLNLAVRRVQSLHRLIARGADRFRDALIDRVARRKRQHLSTRCTKSSSLNRTPHSCWSSSNNQGTGWSNAVFLIAGVSDSGSAADDCAKAAIATNASAIKALNLMYPDSK